MKYESETPGSAVEQRKQADAAPGKAVINRFTVSASQPELAGYVYAPEGLASDARVLVAVHGISRNAAEIVELFRPYADRHGIALIAPVFTADTFKDYQRLGRKGIGPRADLALIRVLNAVSKRTGWDVRKIDLFGFSGGAQFAHRFAMVHPQRVRRLVLGAAGWYTMPDPATPYPHGTGDSGALSAARLHLTAAVRIPTLVMVGELDNQIDDRDLNRARVIREAQGPHRLARANNWARAMNAFAERRGDRGQVAVVQMPRVDHSFRDAVMRGGLAGKLFEHCYANSGEVNHGELENAL